MASSQKDAKAKPSDEFVLVDYADAKDDTKTSAISFNIACLPSIPGWFQPNGDELRPNAERSAQIAGYVKTTADDIVAFLEAWDDDTRDYLQKTLDEASSLSTATNDEKINTHVKTILQKRFRAVTDYYKHSYTRKPPKPTSDAFVKHQTKLAAFEEEYKKFCSKISSHAGCMKQWLKDRIKESKTLKDNLSGYTYCSGNTGQKLLNGGSGLLVFSRYKALTTTFIPFGRVSPGIEDAANKGFMAIEFQVDYSDKPLLFIATHFSGGSDLSKEQLIAKGLGTTSEIRGTQVGQIKTYIERNRATHEASPEAKYCNIVVMGDLNDPWNSERQCKSESTGMTGDVTSGGNGFQKGAIKYGEREAFWNIVDQKSAFPVNFLDVRALPTGMGVGKKDDPVLMQQAVAGDLYTGTTYDENDLKDNLTNKTPLDRQYKTERKRFDVAVRIKDEYVSAQGTLQSSIVPLTEILTAQGYGYAPSDHEPMRAVFGLFNNAKQKPLLKSSLPVTAPNKPVK